MERKDQNEHKSTFTAKAQFPEFGSTVRMPTDRQVTFTVADSEVEGRGPALARLRVHRNVYDQPNFDASYELCDPGPPATPWQNLKRKLSRKWNNATDTKRRCNKRAAYNSLVSWFPCVEWLRKYKIKEYTVPDIVAGLTVGVLNVPQGMAYAMLASCPPVTGLYTSIFPVIIYFLMGTSRQCSMGTFSIVSMMTSKMVLNVVNQKYPGCYPTDKNCTKWPEANFMVNGTQYREIEWTAIQTGATAAFFIGVWQLILGLIGAGAAAVYFSDQLVQGFTCAAAFHVFSSQLKAVFKLPLKEHYGPFKLIKTYIGFFKIIDQSHGTTMILSLICIVVLLSIKVGINDNRRIMRRIKVPVPAELIVVIFGTLASYLMDLDGAYGVKTVHNIPVGMPPLTSPDFSITGDVISDTFSTAIVGLAITVTLGMLFATKHGYSIDANQEFTCQGIGNMFGSFFQCFPSGASIARSAVQNDVGGKTQVVSIIQCILVIVVVTSLGRFLEPLPVACLGAIVMVSVIHLLMQVVELYRLWKLSIVDWSIFLAVFLGVLILDVDIGLGVGVGWAILTVMLRLQKPKVGVLGRMPGTDIYRRIDVYKTAREIPGVKIMRVDAPIYYANSAYIKQRFYALSQLNDLIALWTESKPTKDTVTPAIDGQNEQNFAYSLNLRIGADDDEDVSGGRAAAKLHNVAISMENLTSNMVTEESFGSLSKLGAEAPIKHLIIDCSEVCFVDVTGVGFLKRLQTECAGIGVGLFLASTNKPLRDMLSICGAGQYIKPADVFVTVHDAVLNAVHAQKLVPPPYSSTQTATNGALNTKLARTLSNVGETEEEDESGSNSASSDSTPNRQSPAIVHRRKSTDEHHNTNM